MKHIKYSIILLCLISALSCTHEDSIVPNTSSVVLLEKVSGSVLIDEDLDDLGDIPLLGARVYLGNFVDIREILGQRPDTLSPPYDSILWADVDNDGNYLFEGVAPAETQNLVLFSPEPNSNIKGSDVTPDGDLLEEDVTSIINITIDQNEHDNGNNFIVQLINQGNKISGYINIDTNKDGSYDAPGTNILMSLSHRDVDGNPEGGTLSIATVSTDATGYYEFNDLSPDEYVVIFRLAAEYTVETSSDQSPDLDPTLSSSLYWIPVDVIANEHDEDNNFDISPKWISGSGYILEDTNEDGEGDFPLNQHRVELYKRNDLGEPQGELIAWSNSDAQGFYRFLNIPIGDYVIYYIGAPGYECITSMDRTPEIGEPTINSQCFFIQMDIPIQGSEDFSNVFIVKTS